MVTKPCSSVEIQAQVVKLQSDLQALRDVLTERDIRYTQRALAQDIAVSTALASSKEAVTKAETATEERLKVLNELRGVVVDQSRDFSRKSEISLLISALEKRIDVTTDLVRAQEARGGGVKDAIGWIVGAVGLVLAALATFLRH